MLRQRLLLPLAPLCVGALLLGCPAEEIPITPSGPRAITVEGILADANQNLRAHLIGVASTGKAFEGVELLGQLVRTSTDAPPCVEEECPEPTESPDPVELAEQIADTAAAEVLSASRVEASSETQVTLRFGEELCPKDESGALDGDCVETMAALEPRLVLQSMAEGDVDARLVLGAARSTLASFELHRARLAVDFDLGAAKALALELAPDLDEEGQAALDALRQATLQGRVRAELTALAAAAYRLSFGVSSAVLVEADLDGAPLRLSIATAPQLLSVEADPAAPRLDVSVQAAGAQLTGPLALFIGGDEVVCTPEDPNCEPQPSPDVEGNLQLTVPAAGARLHLGAAEELAFQDIHAAGPVEARLDGQRIASFELGAVPTGSFGLTMTQAQDALRVALTPSARFLMDLDLDPIVEQGLEVPPFLVNERLEVKMDGSSPTLDVREDGQLEVVSGRLSIDSRAANRIIVVNAGQCLVGPEDEPTEEPQHPLDVVEAGVCR